MCACVVIMVINLTEIPSLMTLSLAVSFIFRLSFFLPFLPMETRSAPTQPDFTRAESRDPVSSRVVSRERKIVTKERKEQRRKTNNRDVMSQSQLWSPERATELRQDKAPIVCRREIPNSRSMPRSVRALERSSFTDSFLFFRSFGERAREEERSKAREFRLVSSRDICQPSHVAATRSQVEPSCTSPSQRK